MTILVVSTSTFRFSLNTKRSVVKLFSNSHGEWSRSRAGLEPACGPLPPKQIAVGGRDFFSVWSPSAWRLSGTRQRTHFKPDSSASSTALHAFALLARNSGIMIFNGHCSAACFWSSCLHTASLFCVSTQNEVGRDRPVLFYVTLPNSTKDGHMASLKVKPCFKN